MINCCSYDKSHAILDFALFNNQYNNTTKRSSNDNNQSITLAIWWFTTSMYLFLALHGMDAHSLVLTIASGAGSVGGGVCMPVEGSVRSSCIISRWSWGVVPTRFSSRRPMSLRLLTSESNRGSASLARMLCRAIDVACSYKISMTLTLVLSPLHVSIHFYLVYYCISL
jgi:hypothetical protein